MINHPMASQSLSLLKEFLANMEICFCIYMSLILLFLKFINVRFVEDIFRFFLWLLVIYTGLVVLLLWVKVPTETLAPNFLAACKPLELDLLCSSGFYFDGVPVVEVTCTTPAEVWIPALSNSLPLLSAIDAYVMFTLLFYVIFNWKPKFILKSLILVGLAVNIVLIVGVGCYVIACNEVNVDGVLRDYLKSCIVAWGFVVVGAFCWDIRRNQSDLPSNWNEFLEKIYELPPNLTPLRHEPLPPTTGSSPGDEDNGNSPPNPNLPPKYECPPSYTDAVSVARHLTSSEQNGDPNVTQFYSLQLNV